MILAGADYKILELICHTIASTHSTSTMTTLHISLLDPNYFTACTQLWCPHLMKEILIIEQIQCHAIKYLLNDYISSYKICLIKLKVLPLMYISVWATISITDLLSNLLNYTNYILSSIFKIILISVLPTVDLVPTTSWLFPVIWITLPDIPTFIS